MNWIASLSQSSGSRFHPPFDKTPARGSLRRGTVLLEALLDPITAAQPVLRIPLQAHAAGHLSILALPGGSFSLVLSQGAMLAHKTLRLAQAGLGGEVRLSLAWDCDRSIARFAVEAVGDRAFVIGTLPIPKPLAAASLTSFEAMEICLPDTAELGFLAVSNDVEPVGPLPGLGVRSIVSTTFGPRVLGELACGDLVTTGAGNPPEPVLHVAQRTVPALGSFAPIRLRAPYFDLQQDLIVAAHQKIFMTGSLVEYTFGREAVLVPAEHLVNGVSALRETHVALVTYAQVLLPSHSRIEANGASVESLFIGRLRRDPAKLGASVLCDANPTMIPEQASLASPVLAGYEARALIEVA
ncbi:Hint domain-containing protein [Primorskyibacter aestuariivivens]|uniref:Hint domain-containing protein n=1 Tax=Primorskyibacter aestuariivivens TaxID=1888912 RepID=UPI002300CC6A|nr:Hint domain-containing protein [Primorskyibacter aestuariivivens]MDA7427817.1 Hint domain-containing protein [Primorskyibacter aestuariivivens]